MPPAPIFSSRRNRPQIRFPITGPVSWRAREPAVALLHGPGLPDELGPPARGAADRARVRRRLALGDGRPRARLHGSRDLDARAMDGRGGADRDADGSA